MIQARSHAPRGNKQPDAPRPSRARIQSTVTTSSLSTVSPIMDASEPNIYDAERQTRPIDRGKDPIENRGVCLEL
jgi:hypothetical protein